MDDPVRFSPNQLINSTKLVRNLASCLNTAKKYPLFITRSRGEEIEFVLISLEHYRSLLEEVEKNKSLPPKE